MCVCSVNCAIDCTSARTSAADRCNGRSTAVSWTHAPVWRFALTALKQDPAAQLDKRCARPYIHMGDVKLNAACAPIHSCWHPRPTGSQFSTFWHQVSGVWPPRTARILAAGGWASIHVLQRSIVLEKTSRGLLNKSGFKRGACNFSSA